MSSSRSVRGAAKAGDEKNKAIRIELIVRIVWFPPLSCLLDTML